MPKKQHTEGEIISALKQYEGGEKTTEICDKLGISQATFIRPGRNPGRVTGNDFIHRSGPSGSGQMDET